VVQASVPARTGRDACATCSILLNDPKITKRTSVNHEKGLKSRKTNEANKGKNTEKMTNRIEAKIMKNRQNPENLTKPIETITIFSLAKSQNKVNLKNQSYKTISFKTPLLEKRPFYKTNRS
jgi:hypothetical protein